MKHQYHLNYNSPAQCWPDALPLGNGRMGAMVYGRTDIERIQFNDDSLWYGTFMDRNNPALKDKLPEIRRLVLAGEIREAEEMIMQYMVGAPSMMRRYMNMGELDLALNQHLPFVMGGREVDLPPEKYALDLDLMTGILTEAHTKDGVSYHREMFISHPAQVLCLHLTSDKPGAINLDMKLDRVVISDTTVMDDRRPGRLAGGGGWPAPRADILRAINDNTFLMRGRESDVEFAAAFRVSCDGKLINPVSQLLARDCNEVTIYLATTTSNRTDDVQGDIMKRLDNAQMKGYATLREEHVKDFSSFMGRCSLDLGPAPDKPIDERIKALRNGEQDPAFAALYFQYGRYLLVSGSRQDSAALNLQGIWNADFNPMWDSKYTTNINVQMNYWPAEVGNLSELHTPLFDLLEKAHQRGKETARVMYGMRGMVMHHNTDFYGDCAPQDWYMASTPWITASAWLGLHVWEHYQFTKDLSMLTRMYPILKDICLFYEDFLMEVDGVLVTCPSTSPENRYILPDGYDTPICVGPAMDNQILRAFFSACIEMQALLEIDQDYSPILDGIIKKLRPDQIGSKGQLLEWAEEFPELTPGMGHVSHLFAAFPGSSINWKDTPELLQAAAKSLELRVLHGHPRGEWPLAWYINLSARFLDSEKTDQYIKTMMARSTSRSLLNAVTVFQIDGNFGATAGIAECLLQSHIALHFLPALPISWTKGNVKGLVARGGRTIDMTWTDGKLSEATILPRFDGSIEVVGDLMSVTCDGEPIPVQKTDMGFVFEGKGGCLYKIAP
ncbi:MAG: glycoside hydrolase family 95 protein [Clostridium sp.]|nr:glycoside hydrolase family 95 protein [Clostridium sp.]